MQKIVLEAGKDYNEAIGSVTYEHQVAAVAKMKELGLETRQADMETKQAWAKQIANIPKQRREEINKARLPGDVVYAYIQALKAAGHTFPRDWEAER